MLSRQTPRPSAAARIAIKERSKRGPRSRSRRIDGSDIEAVRGAFDTAKAQPEPKPRMIVCDTRMGCGVRFLEAREKNHFIRVEEHEWQLAIDGLDAGRKA
jgi:transketolase